MPSREELRPFQHLGALHMTDFGRDIFDRAGDNAERGKECGMAVARYDLRADRFGGKAQLFAHVLFDPGVDVCKGPDSARSQFRNGRF